jgi:hypothetical protein
MMSERMAAERVNATENGVYRRERKEAISDRNTARGVRLTAVQREASAPQRGRTALVLRLIQSHLYAGIRLDLFSRMDQRSGE